MFGTTRNEFVAGLLAAALGLSTIPAASAAEDWGFLEGGTAAAQPVAQPDDPAAPLETEAEKRWFDNQTIAPPPGGDEPQQEESTERAIDLTEEGLVETGSARHVDLPSVLKKADAELYQKIFELQDKARWKQADKLLSLGGKKLSKVQAAIDGDYQPRSQALGVEVEDWADAKSF